VRLCPEARLLLVATRADQAEVATVTAAAGHAQGREWGAAGHLTASAATGLGVAAVVSAMIDADSGDFSGDNDA